MNQKGDVMIRLDLDIQSNNKKKEKQLLTTTKIGGAAPTPMPPIFTESGLRDFLALNGREFYY